MKLNYDCARSVLLTVEKSKTIDEELNLNPLTVETIFEQLAMTTRKYRKKPVVIEAYQTDKEMIIHTLEGDMKASVGDYIITGVNGEQYPCKPDIFEKTYEPVGNISE